MPILPEPSWGVAQPVEFSPSAICSLGLSPSRITGALVRLLQAHFYDPENIKDPQLKEVRWFSSEPSDYPIQNTLMIEPAYRYTPKTAGQRPVLLVKKGRTEPFKISLAGKTLTHLERNGTYEGEDHIRMVKGSHMIVAGAVTGLASERLAEEVFNRMMEYSPAIKQDLQFTDFEVGAMGDTVPSEDASDLYITPIAISWTYTYSWTLVQVAPILKKVRIEPTPS